MGSTEQCNGKGRKIMGTVLITGAAGFIGFHTARALLERGDRVIGIDSLNDYYDPALKRARRDLLTAYPAMEMVEAKIETPGLMTDLMARTRPDTVIHLAAQAGVRYSIDNPRAYLEANLVGTFELLEAARAHPPSHMLLASTSSTYGANTQMPYVEDMRTDHQMSFYAATKKANEAMAHSYAHLYGLPTTMFRFFTVYGPWGRPDMALFKFTKAILDDQPIDVYNYGKMRRDFTYIDDLTASILELITASPGQGVATPGDSPVAPYRVINIGTGAPVELMAFITAIEAATGCRARQNLLPMQAGDVPATWASGAALEQLTGSRPTTPVDQGVAQFVDWYRNYYR